MTARLVLATRNAGKVAEMRRLLDGEVEVLGAADLPDVPDVAETGTSFAENALLKAVAVAEASGLPAVADDSGLCVEVLGGAPGIFSARWCGRHGDDAANLDLLLRQLDDLPDAHRGAWFECAVAVAMPDGRQEVVHGRMVGTLLRAPRGTGGFGYDPIFLPQGSQLSSAELTPQQKDAISHRGQALRALVPLLRGLLG